MKIEVRAVLVVLLAAAFFPTIGCQSIVNKLKARDQLNKGVRAYRSAQFNEAIDHFEQAVKDDPSLVNAKLYLATAYYSQFIPGAPSEDNLKMGQKAVDIYRSVLDQPGVGRDAKVNALAGIASVYFGMSKLQESKDYYKQQIALDPSNPVPYYSIGSIDWTMSYQPRMTARAGVGIADQLQPFVGPKATREVKQACQQVHDKDEPIVDEGISNLKKALELRPDYSDAMTYMNLLYREKADLTCGDNAQREADLREADKWSAQALNARKEEAAKASKAGPGGITAK
jgi:tetratricopeptide (TPR) repeat protein